MRKKNKPKGNSSISSQSNSPLPLLGKVLQFVLMAFGLLTLVVGSKALPGSLGLVESPENNVWFVVLTSMLSGLLYLVAAFYMRKRNLRAVQLLTLALVLLLAAFIGFYFYARSGGLYEKRTLFALPFRIGLTLVLVLLSGRVLGAVKARS